MRHTARRRCWAKAECSARSCCCRTARHSKRFEEGDQSCLVRSGQGQSIRMPFYGTRLNLVADETGVDIVVTNSFGVEPILKRRHRSVVLKGPAVPHTVK